MAEEECWRLSKCLVRAMTGIGIIETEVSSSECLKLTKGSKKDRNHTVHPLLRLSINRYGPTSGRRKDSFLHFLEGLKLEHSFTHNLRGVSWTMYI